LVAGGFGVESGLVSVALAWHGFDFSLDEDEGNGGAFQDYTNNDLVMKPPR